MIDLSHLSSLIEQFGSEGRCRIYLEGLRWPNGIRCPRCESSTIYPIVKRSRYTCDGCRYQFSVTAGTIFNNSHLPLWKWFLCVYLLCESKNGMSANRIRCILGVSYKTAWHLCHRVRTAMREVNPGPLTEIIESCITNANDKVADNRRVSESVRAEEVIVGIKLRRGGHVHFLKANAANTAAVAKTIKVNFRNTVAIVISDELPSGIEPAHGQKAPKRRRTTTTLSDQTNISSDIDANSAKSKFYLTFQKKGGVESRVNVSAKHLSAYLDEGAFRLNNQRNPYLLPDTLKRLLQANTLEYKKLTGAAKLKSFAGHR